MAEKCCGKEIKVSFCPKCKSRDVKYTFGLANLYGVIPKMKCEGCGMEMSSFPILVTTKEKLEKSIKEKFRRKKK